jgi:gas vesicle protein
MNKNEKANSGFIFGLTLGAAIGALSSILINKNSNTKVVQNFESKVKDFFQDLINDVKNKKEEPSKKIEFITVEKETEKPSVVIKKKSTPKMFVKAKR